MRPFSAIAIPHKDILEGTFTKDTFAANLWEVYKGRASEEYQDPDIFFKRTYLTEGIKTLLDIVARRFKGKDGYSAIQLQTPFGGGKTHSLIGLYHKAKEWDAKVVVIDGYAFSPKETMIWEEIERQLTGRVEKLKGNIPPAGEQLRELFLDHQPLLILMDEILEYTIASSGIRVGESTLASQVLNFMRYLTDTIRTIDKTALVITYPSVSHYNNHGQRLLNQLQLRSGRISMPYSPVRDEEIYDVIGKRFFTNIDRKAAKDVIDEFLDYAELEKLLPEGIDRSSYREKFLKSFPFQPEVIDVLYKRWGSFPIFERTRGVLFLLASVVHSLKDSTISFIRLADFDLRDDRIRTILIDVVGPEYNSIIAQDITSTDSGAKRVDKNLPSTYSPYSLGMKAATTIFMCSFSGGPERGVVIDDIKLACAEPTIPSAIVVDVVNKLTDPFVSLYLDFKDGKYLFTDQIPLRRVLANKMDSLKNEETRSLEKQLLSECLGKAYYFECPIIWPKISKDIPDTKGLKLIVSRVQDDEKCKEFLNNYGERPRVYQNTVIFLCPLDAERPGFENFLRGKLAWQLIEKDKTLPLTDNQRKEVKENIKKAETEDREHIRTLYRVVLLPSKGGFKEIDLGIPTYGTDISIDKEIYDRLRSEGEVLENLAPLILKERYLKDRDYVEIKNILGSFFKTPGEIRIISDEVLKDCVKEGVGFGLFGLGDIENKEPICRHFKIEFSPKLIEGEILIKAELCLPEPEERMSDGEFQSYISKIREGKTIESIGEIKEKFTNYTLSPEQKGKFENEIKEKIKELGGVTPVDKYHNINLKLDVPTGKLADIVRIVNYIKSKFDAVNIKVEISMQGGEIAISDYEDKIKEAVNQANVTIEKEEVE